MVTIYDIAKRMRLSHTTVSMGLRNLPCVKDSTRLRIHETARRMGYRKNQIALSLKRGVFKRIVLVVHSYGVYEELIGVLGSLCSGAGYELVLMHLDESPENMKRTFGQIVDGGYAGCAAYFYNFATVANFVCDFIARGYPFIALNVPPDLPPKPGLFRMDVTADTAVHEALELLHRLGHRNIACAVMESFFSSYPAEKYYKYIQLKSFLAAHSIEPPWDPGFFYKSHYPINHIQDGYNAAQRILVEKQGVTALLCKNDQFAFGLMRGLAEQGIKVPEDISLVASDNSQVAKYAFPSISSVDLRQKDMAQMIWKIFSNELEKNNFSEIPETVFLEGKLIIRESVGKVKES